VHVCIRVSVSVLYFANKNINTLLLLVLKHVIIGIGICCGCFNQPYRNDCFVMVNFLRI
jgi:hypothetical protein